MSARHGQVHWAATGSSGRRSQPCQSTLSEDNAACLEQARRIQATHRQWVVMWSAWRRTYTAFSCFTTGPLVVDEATPDGLVSAMVRAELHYSPTRVDALGGVVVS
jgi:hypothetical protein